MDLNLDQVKTFLERICNETGVSGYEGRVAAIVQETFKRYCDEVHIDKIGNVIGLRKGYAEGNRPRFMMAAHMDEIGLMVKCIDDDGLVRFVSVGGYDQRVLMAQEAIIHGREKVFGVIGMKPPHIMPEGERNNAIKLDDLTIDTGYPKEKLEELVRVGDIITLNIKMIPLQNDILASKAFDDRAGVASLLACMMSLENTRHAMDVYYVATVQEEVGLHGAKVSSYDIKPDIAIAIDVGFGRTPELKEFDSDELCKGPAIARGPNIHHKVFEGLKAAGKDNGVPYQVSAVSGGSSGTDATELQISGTGAACGLLSIPLKYMHTTVETICFNDVIQTGRLLAAYITSLNDCDPEVELCC